MKSETDSSKTGAALANRPHEIAFRHDARDLVVVFHDDDAANAMLRKQLNDLFAVVVTTPLPFCFITVAAFISFFSSG
jgi:hypothetical protein